MRKNIISEAQMKDSSFASRQNTTDVNANGNNERITRRQLIEAREKVTIKMQEYFDKYVPSVGKADTVFGEIVRAWNYLHYQLFCNGESPHLSYARDGLISTMDYLNYIIEEDFKCPRYQYGTEYRLYNYGARILLYIERHPELATLKNDYDSRIFRE